MNLFLTFDDPLEGAAALVARPDYETEPTFVTYLPAIPRCDTLSVPDNRRVLAELVSHSPGSLVRRVIGDGQTVQRLRTLKKANPERYRWLWIDPADMHAYAHAIYSGHIVFWDCLLLHCKEKLGRRHIEQRPYDLSDDKFEAHKVFNLVVYLAIVVFFSEIFDKDVLRSSSRTFDACSGHAGLLTLHWFAYLHGQNVCSWWMAQRSNDGGELDKLWLWYYAVIM